MPNHVHVLFEVGSTPMAKVVQGWKRHTAREANQLLGQNGPIGALLQRVGLEIVFSWPATVLSAAVVAFPLMYRSALAALEQVDPSLPQVARSLGASELRVLHRITLPLALPGLVAGLSLSFARALGEFGTTLMLAGNIPGRTQTLPLAIYAAVEAGDLGLAWFWTALVLGLNAISLLLMQGLEHRSWRPRGPAAPHPRRRPAIRDAVPQRRRREGPFRLQLAVSRRLGAFDLQVQLASSSRRLAVLGASGAGKSQLLRTLAGLERPDRAVGGGPRTGWPGRQPPLPSRRSPGDRPWRAFVQHRNCPRPVPAGAAARAGRRHGPRRALALRPPPRALRAACHQGR
jgi:ABC-type molybdate transport system permease subunit